MESNKKFDLELKKKIIMNKYTIVCLIVFIGLSSSNSSDANPELGTIIFANVVSIFVYE